MSACRVPHAGLPQAIEAIKNRDAAIQQAGELLVAEKVRAPHRAVWEAVWAVPDTVRSGIPRRFSCVTVPRREVRHVA